MPMDRSLYPADWEKVSALIRFQRAENRCECTGECHHGAPWGHKWRCREVNHTPSQFQRGRVILTVAHLCDCYPLCSNPAHLKAMCQACHLRFDRFHHWSTRQQKGRRLHPAPPHANPLF